MTSSRAVSTFIAIRKSIAFLRATYPSLLARMVYHVGNPAILEGKRFLPETGTPIWKMVRNSTELADCEPEPLTVATWMLRSLTICFGSVGCGEAASCTPTSLVAIGKNFLQSRM